MTEQYTLGYSDTALAFVSRRTLESHGAFFFPHLRPGISVLDCGCGPGSITFGIATRVPDGRVVGVDMHASQIELAARATEQRGIGNVEFRQASVYSLPFGDATFDAVFSHALLEHLREPGRAVREFFRVLKPGGVAGVCTPDWGGFLVSPPTPEVRQAMRAYAALQNRNGGDVETGSKLLGYLRDAGFTRIEATARYENYAPRTLIADLLAFQLDDDGDAINAEALRTWARLPYNMFAQAWVSCVGYRSSERATH